MIKPTVPRLEDETQDTFYRGRIRILQKIRGYRFSVDSPLLADFVRTEASDEILELGAGCGVVSLLLSIKPFRKITALEIQPALADLARRNVAQNGLEAKIQIIEGDWREFRPGRKFDLVLSNPPYIKKSSGYLSLTEEKSVAKHEIHGEIEDVMKATAELLRSDGRASFVFPEKRRREFLVAASASGLVLRLVRAVLARESGPPNLFLAELGFSPGPGTAKILPPLVLFGEDGRYSAEADEIFAGRVP